MEPLFEGLTESEIEYLKYLIDRGYYDGFEMELNLDVSSDFRVQKLESEGYITFEDSGPYAGNPFLIPTSKGIAAIVDHDKYASRIKPIELIAEAAQKQANAATQEVALLKEQLEFTKSQAESAKKDALFAKVTSIIAILISIAAIVVPQVF